MVTVGIDKVAFHVPHHYVALEKLAQARGVDPNKFIIGIGQTHMAVASPAEDIVSLAANAAAKILTDDDKQAIEQVIFATESGIDYSKSAASFVHDLLAIQPFAKSYEVKHACYGGTAALLAGADYVRLNPDKKVLVVIADIARYGLNSGGEPTQGAGAVALLVTANPRILSLDKETISMTVNEFDFWRPNYAEVPYVDGKFSQDLYIKLFNDIIGRYSERYPDRLKAIKALTFHMPFTKMGKKCLQSLEGSELIDPDLLDQWHQHYSQATEVSRYVGNVYNGSLYLSLISLLSYDKDLQAGDTLGLFSYGSGAVAELFTGQLVEGFQEHVTASETDAVLANRKELSVVDYEALFEATLEPSEEVVDVSVDPALGSGFYLDRVDRHRRIYTHR